MTAQIWPWADSRPSSGWPYGWPAPCSPSAGAATATSPNKVLRTSSLQIGFTSDRQPPHLGIWALLPLPAQREELRLEPQAGVLCIYWEMELNLRIKPRKRLVREKPATLAVPEAINQVLTMDFIHDKLEDGRIPVLPDQH